MTRDEIDTLWMQALRESVRDGEDFIRYHFAALVVAHEREACAMEANYEAARWPYLPESRIPCEDIAAAIRARGEK